MWYSLSSLFLYRLLGRAFISLSLFWSLVACSTYPPVEEYVLAHAAFHASNLHNSSSYATIHHNKSKQSYYLAVKMFKKKKFDRARSLFLKSTTLAEMAENISRLRLGQEMEEGQ